MLASEPQMIQYIYVHTVRRALSFEHGGIVSRHVGAKHKAGARVVTTCTSIAARCYELDRTQRPSKGILSRMSRSRSRRAGGWAGIRTTRLASPVSVQREQEETERSSRRGLGRCMQQASSDLQRWRCLCFRRICFSMPPMLRGLKSLKMECQSRSPLAPDLRRSINWWDGFLLLNKISFLLLSFRQWKLLRPPAMTLLHHKVYQDNHYQRLSLFAYRLPTTAAPTNTGRCSIWYCSSSLSASSRIFEMPRAELIAHKFLCLELLSNSMSCPL